MDKWEYKAITVQTLVRAAIEGRTPFTFDPKFKMDELNKLGTEGWEAVNVQGTGIHNSGMLVLLKRKIK